MFKKTSESGMADLQTSFISEAAAVTEVVCRMPVPRPMQTWLNTRICVRYQHNSSHNLNNSVVLRQPTIKETRGILHCGNTFAHISVSQIKHAQFPLCFCNGFNATISLGMRLGV